MVLAKTLIRVVIMKKVTGLSNTTVKLYKYKLYVTV